MKVAKVSDLENLASGTVIGEITVTIKSVYAAKEGVKNGKPWRLQNAVVTDSTGEAKATFFNELEMQNFRGKTVTLKSVAGSRGLGGVSVKFSDHSNKNEISVSSSAQILTSEGGAVADYIKAAPKPSAAANEVPKLDPSYAIGRVNRSALLYIECFKAAKVVAEATGAGLEHFQAICSSLYISADRAGLADYFPSPPAAVVESMDAKQVELLDDEIPF